MPIDVRAVNQLIDQEDEELRAKVTEIGGRKDLTYDEKRDATTIAINMAIHARLGDMIKLQLQKG